MSTVDFNQELDCKGMACPLPILKTKKQIDAMNSGEVLKMVATDPGSINDITAWSKQTGNELISHSSDDGNYVFYIRKS